MFLGLDFDNTLIRYDEVFVRIAREKKLVPKGFPAEKNAIRDYLRRLNLEHEWTLMQGEAYGPRIREAVPFEGMFETLTALRKCGISMCLVSHKTRTPYMGPEHDLHQAARRWLFDHEFFDEKGMGWLEEEVFFELTKEDKVRRIVAMGCTHYVDDLPEILAMLPESIDKILFAPKGEFDFSSDWKVLRKWTDLPCLLH